VTAKDKATGRQQDITITASSGLTEAEIQRMVREAEQHAAEDRSRKEAAELRNEADTLAYSAEKTLKDLGDKVPANLRSEVEAKVREVREAMNGTDTARLRQRKDELQQLLQRVGGAAYEQGGGTPPPGGDQAQGDSGTVDGEFREV